jgi:hypothetical protein
MSPSSKKSEAPALPAWCGVTCRAQAAADGVRDQWLKQVTWSR